MTAPRFVVVGSPDSRRTVGFRAAALAAGCPAPRVLLWSDVLREGNVRFLPGEIVRLDSPDGDPVVDRLLRGPLEPTRVEGTARWYRGLADAARDIGRAARRDGARMLDDPAELAVLFDKRLCHGRLTAAGVPVPASPTSGPDAPVPADWAGVRELLRDAGLSRAFVKPAHGSSASGVLALEIAGGGRVQATTSVELAADGSLHNSLRVRRYRTEREVAAIVDALAPDGLHLERWLPKAGQDGRTADLRVVVVAGRAGHAVVRTSRSPMTNLHLGGVRGDLARALAGIPAGGGDPAEPWGIAERAAGCFPGTLSVGVDVLPGTGWRTFRVGEVNAFGDLLPGLLGAPGRGAEHSNTWETQVAAVLAGCPPVGIGPDLPAPAPVPGRPGGAR
ncbi:STM4014 family protein [Streptomyces sp. ST2-7A]|nr:STM4014 family protein [Streptomyces sp. ST2-7A]MCE7079292.1 STM4014 family protein [Streptomyces sp. ST2-7A]